MLKISIDQAKTECIGLVINTTATHVHELGPAQDTWPTCVWATCSEHKFAFHSTKVLKSYWTVMSVDAVIVQHRYNAR